MRNYISFVGHYKKMVNDSLCDDIMNTDFLYSKSTYANHYGKSQDDDRVKMDEIWIRKNEKFYDKLKDIILEVTDLYSKQMEKRNKRNFVAQMFTDFRVNKYEKGGYMSLHCDNIHHSHGQQYGYPQATCLLFLNDDFKGGQFIVSDLHLNIKKGDALIFPSNFMFPHEVKKIEEGTRWTIVSWLL